MKLMAGKLKDPARLRAEGVADSAPLVPNDSAANRARNRRVGDHAAERAMIPSIRRWMRNRWFLGALALVAFSLVTWFVGDLVSFGAWRPFETPAGRAALIAAAGVAWLGLEFRRSRKARMENEKLLEVLAGGGDSDSAARAAREIAVLRQRFEEAAAILKRARFDGPDGEQPLRQRTAVVRVHRRAWIGQDHRAGQFRPALPARGKLPVRAETRRSPASAARATATGGLPMRRCCLTRRAATRPRRAIWRPMPRPGLVSSI